MHHFTADAIWSPTESTGYGGLPAEYGNTADVGAQVSTLADQVQTYGADLLTFRPAEEPADLLPEPAPQVALLTVMKAEHDPEYREVVLSWPAPALFALHRSLEAQRSQFDNPAPRSTAHREVIEVIREAQQARASRRRLRMAGMAVLGIGGAYLLYRVVT